ncbi:MAG: hypothetical protein R6X22_00460 [Gemmatimonadota bacterium]
MFSRKGSLALAVLAAVALTGCSDDAGPLSPSTDGLTQLEAQAIALEMEVSSADAVDGAIAEGEAGLLGQSLGFLASVPPMFGSGTDEVTFTRTRACALGGEVVVEGTLTREWIAETRHVTVDVAATKTHADCTFPVRSAADTESGEPVTITLSGNPNVVITAHREREMGYFVGLQTMSHVGSIAWEKSDGMSGVCDIDIQAVIDPDARTRTVVGTVCDRTFERTWSWDRLHHGPGGLGD